MNAWWGLRGSIDASILTFHYLIFYFTSYFFSGEALNKYYFPTFVPAGVVGNLLSFMVR